MAILDFVKKNPLRDASFVPGCKYNEDSETVECSGEIRDPDTGRVLLKDGRKAVFKKLPNGKMSPIDTGNLSIEGIQKLEKFLKRMGN